MNNIITLTDSYKLSHWKQYPEGTTKIYSYMEARGGDFEEIVFNGLDYYLRTYLEGHTVWREFTIEAEYLAAKHGLPFNFEGWKYIDQELNGSLPIEIKALPENTLAKVGEPLMLITNTDPNCYWLVNYLETLLMKTWYPISVATRAYEVRKILEKYWSKTVGDIYGVDFAFHNFGDRGSSSVESALIGGLAHLTQFKGTDNFACIEYSEGYSIPASEHSTVTSWGRENEFKFYDNYLELYKGQPMVACVMDSYNIYEAVDYISSGEFKDKVESDEYPTFVIRPDSGDPIMVIQDIIHILEDNKVDFSRNARGYKVFDKYRIIWGDGITKETISAILDFTQAKGYSAENFAFGCGGYLMQQLDRDTHKMAIKACAIELADGTVRDVYKDPVTDQGKTSKRGIQDNPRFVTRFKDGVVYE